MIGWEVRSLERPDFDTVRVVLGYIRTTPLSGPLGPVVTGTGQAARLPPSR